MVVHSKSTITNLKKLRSRYPVGSRTYNNLSSTISRKRIRRSIFKKDVLRDLFN